jgi:hypothetical protein
MITKTIPIKMSQEVLAAISEHVLSRMYSLDCPSFTVTCVVDDQDHGLLNIVVKTKYETMYLSTMLKINKEFEPTAMRFCGDELFLDGVSVENFTKYFSWT